MKISNLLLSFFLLLSIVSLQAISLVDVASLSIGVEARGAAWLEFGSDKFLAIGATLDLVVYRFTGSSLVLVDSVNLTLPEEIGRISWLQSGGTNYLAVATGGGGFGMIRIYTFDGSTLTEITGGSSNLPLAFGASANGVEWLQSGGSDFLAVAGFDNAGNEVSVFSFDGMSLTFLDGVGYSLEAEDTSWLTAADSTIYLASGGDDGGSADIRLFTFDGLSLTLVDSVAVPDGSNAVSLVQLANGSIFLATSNNPSGSMDEIEVYQLVGSTLTLVDSDVFGTEGFEVDWFQMGGMTFLAAGGNVAPEWRVYTFDGAILTLLASGTIGGDVGRAVDWLQIGNMLFLGAAGEGGDEGNFGTAGVLRLCEAPIANCDVARTDPDTPVVINVVANDKLECATLQDTLITPPSNGMAVVNSAAGTITYIPNPGFVGVDSLVYEICDTSQCSQASVDIVVMLGQTNPLAKAIQDKYFGFCDLICD